MAQVFTNQAPNVPLPGGGSGVRNSDFEGTVTLSDNMQAGQYVSGSLDFRLANQGAGYNESGLGYFLRVNEYNSSDQLIAQQTIIPFRKIYWPKSSNNEAQWNTGKIFNWGVSSGWSSIKSGVFSYPHWISLSYGTLTQLFNQSGGSTGKYNGYVNLEPMLVRYASDNLSSRTNLYKPITKLTAANWSKANPFTGSSTPSGGARVNNRASVPFGFTLNGNTSYINFDCVFYNASQSKYRTTITWPSQQDAKVDPGTHVNNASHIFRNNGSSFVADSVAYVLSGSWNKAKIYRYDGSNWNKI